MSEDTTTTTEQEPVQAQEIAQPEEPETQAVQSEEANVTSEDDTTNQTNSSDDEIMEWATKKGLKTDDPIAILKMARESERRMHAATQEAKALKNSVSTIGEEQGYDETSQVLNRLKVTEFYLNNPDAKALDGVMADIIDNAKDDEEKYFLSTHLETVYKLAKIQSAESEAVLQAKAKQEGQREALAQMAQAEQAMPPQPSASTRQGVAEITDEDIANMSASEYLQFKKDHPEWNPFV